MRNSRTYSCDMIETIAELVRNKLHLFIPIDLTDAVNQLGGECIPIDTIKYDARIRISHQITGNMPGFRIYYANNQSPECIRFLIARELGCLFLYILQPDGRLCKEPKQYLFAEQEVNSFAASLLMPKDEFVIFCMNKQDEYNMINLDHVAGHFMVPKQAVYIRGRVLKLW